MTENLGLGVLLSCFFIVLVNHHRRLLTMAKTLDDIQANEVKLRKKVEDLIVLVQTVPPGTFTPEQQAQIDAIVADQETVLGEGAPVPTT